MSDSQSLAEFRSGLRSHFDVFFRQNIISCRFLGAESGYAALHRSLANRFRAKLNFLHVVEDGNELEKRWQRMGRLAAFVARIPGGMYLQQNLAYGKPAQTIIRYAEAHEIDIVAMPTSLITVDSGGAGAMSAQVHIVPS